MPVPVEAAANIQISTCSPNFLIQESVETMGGFHARILKEPLIWEEGYILPPTKPGLGVELDEDVISQYSYQGNDTSIDVYDDQPYVGKALRPLIDK